MVNDGLDDLRELMSFTTSTTPRVSSSVSLTRAGKARDSQRSKVYASEDAVDVELRRVGQQWVTIPEMQAYADKLIRSAWFKRRWPILKGVIVNPGAGNRRASCTPNVYWPTIKMPRWARTEWCFLHEMAHAVTNVERRTAWHGPEFVSNYLILVRHQLGDEAWRLLRQSFLDHKVRIKRPSKTKRELTPEQRAAAVERLAKARAAKSAKS